MRFSIIPTAVLFLGLQLTHTAHAADYFTCESEVTDAAGTSEKLFVTFATQLSELPIPSPRYLGKIGAIVTSTSSSYSSFQAQKIDFQVAGPDSRTDPAAAALIDAMLLGLLNHPEYDLTETPYKPITAAEASRGFKSVTLFSQESDWRMKPQQYGMVEVILDGASTPIRILFKSDFTLLGRCK